MQSRALVAMMKKGSTCNNFNSVGVFGAEFLTEKKLKLAGLLLLILVACFELIRKTISARA